MRGNSRTIASRVLLLLAALAYSGVPWEIAVGIPLDPMRSFLSELAAADQPTGVFFRALDATTGVLVLAGLAFVDWRARTRLVRFAAVALSGFAVFTVLDAMFPMTCASSVSAVCARADAASALGVAHQIHAVTSASATAAATVSAVLLALAFWRAAGVPASRRIMVAAWVGVLLFVTAVVLVATLVGAGDGQLPVGGGIVQRAQVLLLSGYLGCWSFVAAATESASPRLPTSSGRLVVRGNRALAPSTGTLEGASATRLIGLDLFRAVAVFGMLVAHVGPASWTAGEGLGTIHWQWEVFHSRMPAMFAFAAGISLNLGSDRVAQAVQPGNRRTVIRALLLALCGFGLTALGTPAMVILAYFALWFLLILPFRRLSVRGLLIATGIWGVVGPPLSFVLRSTIELPGNALWMGIVSGDYPALTWMPFMLAGLAVGRIDLGSRCARVRLAVWGGTTAAIAYGLSTLFVVLGGAQAIADGLRLTGGRDPIQQFAYLFFRERGVTDTSSPLWLLAPAPHSGSWADVFGCLGMSALLLAALLCLGDGAQRAAAGPRATGRVTGAVFSAFAAVGAMVLSVYVVHIVAMFAIEALTDHSFSGPQSSLVLAGFTVALVVFSALWLRTFRRGPFEWMLAQATSLIVRTGRRVSAGSPRL